MTWICWPSICFFCTVILSRVIEFNQIHLPLFLSECYFIVGVCFVVLRFNTLIHGDAKWNRADAWAAVRNGFLLCLTFAVVAQGLRSGAAAAGGILTWFTAVGGPVLWGRSRGRKSILHLGGLALWVGILALTCFREQGISSGFLFIFSASATWLLLRIYLQKSFQQRSSQQVWGLLGLAVLGIGSAGLVASIIFLPKGTSSLVTHTTGAALTTIALGGTMAWLVFAVGRFCFPRRAQGGPGPVLHQLPLQGGLVLLPAEDDSFAARPPPVFSVNPFPTP